jgi:hypothetical protein
LTREEKAIIRATKPNDKHGIRYELCDAVADFTDCKYWFNTKRVYPNGNQWARARKERTVVYAGLPSDVQFAEWLLDHLENFVRGELAEYLAKDWRDASERRRRINGFVVGCCARISERMRELVRQSKVKAQAVSNSRALVLVNIKKQAIDDVMKADGIRLTHSVGRSRRIDFGAIGAGRLAGERASFGRPVGGGAQARLGK